MPRIRTIKPEFYGSPDTRKASAVGRLAYIGMWGWADDHGRGMANLKGLEGFIFPDDDLEELSFGVHRNFLSILKEVRDCYGIVLYEVAGRYYYEIPNWNLHQRTERTAKSKHPASSEGVPWDPWAANPVHRPTQTRTDLHSSGNHVYLPSGPKELPTERAEAAGASGTGTGEQGNRGSNTNSSQAEPASETLVDLPADPDPKPKPKARRKRVAYGSGDFDAFMDVYPRNDDRKKAWAAWEKALRESADEDDPAAAGALVDKILDGAKRYRDDPNRSEQFTKQPATWLNAGSWDNGPLPPRHDDRGHTAFQNPPPSAYDEDF